MSRSLARMPAVRRLAALLALVLVVGVTTVLAASNDPVGWWKLDETVGAIAFDSSGNGNDGTISGNVTLGVPGVVGTAYGFDGAADTFVAIPWDSALTPAQLTLSVRVNPTSYTCIGSGGQCAVASNEGLQHTGDVGYGLRLFADGVAQWCVGVPGNAACAYSAHGAVPLSKWTSIVGTYDSATGRAAVYVNGELTEAAEAHLFNPSFNAPGTSLTTIQPLYIGRLADPTFIFSWKGSIDDLQIHDRILPAGQLAVLACKDGGWQSMGFKNMGQCLRSVRGGS